MAYEPIKENEIIEIEKVKSHNRYCNVCNNEITEEASGGTLNVDNRTHELRFGRNRHSTTISLCSRCLNNFAEVLWQYLEEEM